MEHFTDKILLIADPATQTFGVLWQQGQAVQATVHQTLTSPDLQTILKEANFLPYHEEMTDGVLRVRQNTDRPAIGIETIDVAEQHGLVVRELPAAWLRPLTYYMSQPQLPRTLYSNIYELLLSTTDAKELEIIAGELQAAIEHAESAKTT